MNNKYRVLMIVQSHYLTDPRVRREAEALSNAQIDVAVISLRNGGDPFRQKANGVTIYGVPPRRKFGGKGRYLFEYCAFLILATILSGSLHLRYRYRLVQIHNLPDTLILAALLPKLIGARVVFDAHEAMPESLRIKYGWTAESGWSRLSRWIERTSMSFADHVLTIHEPMRQLFISRGLPPDKISVVMNWPDDRQFKFMGDASPGSKEEFTLVYAGTIARRYGLQTAIRALPQLTKLIPHIRLQIVGRGDYSIELRHLAKDLNVEESVLIEPSIPHDQMAGIYRLADVGICPHDDELFGQIYFSTKVAEYLAVGLPAVVAKTPVMARYYDETQVAFFTPGNHEDFAARVIDLFNDWKYRDRLVRNGLILSKACSWSKERHEYLSTVMRLMGDCQNE